MALLVYDILPLSSAPKDGTYVILFIPSQNILGRFHVTTAKYSKGKGDYAWRCLDDYSVLTRFGQPTGWIPLPQDQNKHA